MNWEYLAGFTDGDGSVSLKKEKYPCIFWSQKYEAKEVIDSIYDFLKINGYNPYIGNVKCHHKNKYGTRIMRVVTLARRNQVLEVLST